MSSQIDPCNCYYVLTSSNGVAKLAHVEQRHSVCFLEQLET